MAEYLRVFRHVGFLFSVIQDSRVDHQASLHVQERHVGGLMSKPVELDKFIGVAKSRRRSWLAELVQCSIA